MDAPIVEGAPGIDAPPSVIDLGPDAHSPIEVAPQSDSKTPMAGSKDAEPKAQDTTKKPDSEDMPMGNEPPTDPPSKQDPMPPMDEDGELFGEEDEEPAQPNAAAPEDDDSATPGAEDTEPQPDANTPPEEDGLFGEDPAMPDAPDAGTDDIGAPEAGDADGADVDPDAGAADPTADGDLLDEPAGDDPADAPAGDPADGAGEAPPEDDDPFGDGALRTQPSVELLSRVWVDDTGTFAVRAKISSVLDGKVRLLKDTGKYTTVPMSRLSQADRDYVAQLVAKYGQAAIQQLASR